MHKEFASPSVCIMRKCTVSSANSVPSKVCMMASQWQAAEDRVKNVLLRYKLRLRKLEIGTPTNIDTRSLGLQWPYRLWRFNEWFRFDRVEFPTLSRPWIRLRYSRLVGSRPRGRVPTIWHVIPKCKISNKVSLGSATSFKGLWFEKLPPPNTYGIQVVMKHNHQLHSQSLLADIQNYLDAYNRLKISLRRQDVRRFSF